MSRGGAGIDHSDDDAAVSESGHASGRAVQLLGDAIGLPPPSREATNDDVWVCAEQIGIWAEPHSEAEIRAALDRTLQTATAEQEAKELRGDG